MTLYHGIANWGHTIHASGGASPLEQEQVPSLTLERFFSLNGISHVDHMKMNIEGAEYDLLSQAPQEVLQSIRLMLVELHPAEDTVAEEMLQWIRSCGFTTDRVWSEDPTVKGWLIAARRRLRP